MNTTVEFFEYTTCFYCGHRYIARFTSTTSEVSLFLENHRRYRAVLHSFLAHEVACGEKFRQNLLHKRLIE